LHDIQTLDKRGIAGCVVVSKEFEPAAVAQSKSLGFQPALVWVPHPIQNRTEDELKVIAEDSVEAIDKPAHPPHLQKVDAQAYPPCAFRCKFECRVKAVLA